MSPPPVVLTRREADNATLAEALTAVDVPTVSWPAVRFELTGEPETLARRLFDTLQDVLTVVIVSPAAARALLQAWPGFPDFVLDEDEEPIELVVPGPGTADVLADADLCSVGPTDGHDAAAVVAMLAAHPPRTPVVVVQGDLARPHLVDGLREAGLTVRPITLYRNVAPPDLARPEQPVAAVVVASPSAAERHLAANPWLATAPFVAIGETTAAAVRRLAPSAPLTVADEPSVEGLVRAVRRVIGG